MNVEREFYTSSSSSGFDRAGKGSCSRLWNLDEAASGSTSGVGTGTMGDDECAVRGVTLQYWHILSCGGGGGVGFLRGCSGNTTLHLHFRG